MEMDNDILRAVSDNDNEASLLLLDAIANESGDARVSAIALEYILRASEDRDTYTALRTMTVSVCIF